jgi:hypothetical protein
MQTIAINIDTGRCEVFYMRDVKDITRLVPKNKSKDVLVYITDYGTFTPINTLEDAEKAYRQFGFEFYDQSHVINSRKVKEVKTDKQGKWVILDDGTQINVSLRTRKK